MLAGTFEADRSVALLALNAIRTRVDVVLGVARDAIGFELDFGCRPDVTAFAFELRVRASERESGLPRVVEFPQPPAVRGVAGVALGPHAPLVYVALLVAATTGRIRDVIGAFAVALLARDGDVQSKQRELGQVMIEVHDLLPSFRDVTLVAPNSEAACMYVACPMAAHAFRRQLVSAQRRCMTRMTVDLGVEAGKLPMAVARVIELHRFPFLRSVAMVALRCESSRMRVLALMAAGAILRQLVMQVAAAMAVLAFELGMRAFERESRLPGMVEF